MSARRRAANQGGTARQTPADRSPAMRFASETAFDARFEGRRWDEVEPELRTEYPNWLRRHGAADAAPEWNDVKGEVRDAWDAALDVARAAAARAWEDRAPQYRRMWESRVGAGAGRWEDVEPGYRYADAMASDPRYLGRPFDDVAHGLEAGLPVWAASHGYRVADGEGWWDRLRDAVRDAWDHVMHRKSA
jgi:hypothetical protein